MSKAANLAVRTDEPLFSPYRLEMLGLANRMVMAPMTRSGALSDGVSDTVLGKSRSASAPRATGRAQHTRSPDVLCRRRRRLYRLSVASRVKAFVCLAPVKEVA